MLLSPGTRYIVDGVEHEISPTEEFIGSIPRFTPERQHFLERLKGILRYFHETCEKYSIKYYLSCGTLLGALKVKGILPWDTDGDVSIPRSEVLKLKAAFMNGPYKLIPFRYGYKLAVTEFPYYPFVDLMIVDIDPRYPEPTYAFCYPLDSQDKPTFEMRLWFNKKKHPLSIIYPLRKYEFEGMELWGPADGHEVCRLNYGEKCFTTSLAKHFRKHCISAWLRI